MSLCGICNSNPSKYKCPTCTLPYCSLACYKPHKTTHPSTAPPAASEPKPTSTESTARPIPTIESDPTDLSATEEDPFAPLLTHPHIQQLLRSPTLRQHLLSIHEATLEPPSGTESHRGRSGKFRGRGRGRGGKNFVEKPWTPERGEKRGLGKLRWLREGGGAENKEVEEFVRAVIGVVDKEEE